MRKEGLLLLIPIAIFVGITIFTANNLTELYTDIIERLHTPVDNPVLPDRVNKDLTCHKAGLYTDWDERFFGNLGYFMTGISVGDHARQMFFEYDCSLVCYKYWESDKMCLGELYPHE